MIVPWAHGFKSIKWLQRIVLTNDFKANDTYADANNDPDSYLKTMARMDDSPEKFPAGKPITLTGIAMVGWSGLKRVVSTPPEMTVTPAPASTRAVSSANSADRCRASHPTTTAGGPAG